MKIVIRLGIAIGLPLIAVVAFALATNRGEVPPERSQTLIDVYLRRTGAVEGPAYVAQVAPAGNPAGLTRDLSAYTLGYGTYYNTKDLVAVSPAVTSSRTPVALTDAPLGPTPDLSGLTEFPGGTLDGKPLPFPPTYAFCVLIKRGERNELVILAQHQDMYNADWVLHTTRLTPQAAARALACDLNWTQ